MECDPTTANCLNGIDRGNGPTNRDGDKIVIDQIFINGTIKQQAQDGVSNAPPSPSTVFIALVLDKQTNGVQLDSEDVYTNPGNCTDLTASPVRNLQNTSRFKVLWKQRYVIQPGDWAWNGTNMDFCGNLIKFQKFLKVNIPVQYTGSGATVSVISDNSLHVLACKSESTGELSPVTNLNYNARVRFRG